MAKLPSLSKLRMISSAVKNRGTLIGLSVASGAVTGFASSQPGHRTEGAKEGALVGLGVSGGYLAAKNKTIRAATKAGAKAASNVLFRRVGGRVIPIRGR